VLFLIALAWFASGVLGAYIWHRFADDGYYDTRLNTVIVMALFGPIIFLAVSSVVVEKWLKYSKVLNKVVFKSKH
jgi:hypothetical protein